MRHVRAIRSRRHAAPQALHVGTRVAVRAGDDDLLGRQPRQPRRVLADRPQQRPDAPTRSSDASTNALSPSLTASARQYGSSRTPVARRWRYAPNPPSYTPSARSSARGAMETRDAPANSAAYARRSFERFEMLFEDGARRQPEKQAEADRDHQQVIELAEHAG